MWWRMYIFRLRVHEVEMGSNSGTLCLHRLKEAVAMPYKVRVIRRHYGHYRSGLGGDILEGNVGTWPTDARVGIVGELSNFIQS